MFENIFRQRRKCFESFEKLVHIEFNDMDVTKKQVLEEAPELRQKVSELEKTVSELLRHNEQLRYRIQQLLHSKFGPKGERFDSSPQMLLFIQQAMAEIETAANTKEPEAKAEDPEESQERKGHGRSKAPSGLPRTTVVHDLPDNEKVCSCCGSELVCIGRDVSEQYDYVPASYSVIEHIRPKYACKKCDDSPVVSADKPRQPIEKGLPTAAMVAHVISEKFDFHMPTNRQSRKLRSCGLYVPRQTLGDWMSGGARQLNTVYEEMVKRVLQSKSINTDDTTIPVRDKKLDRTKKGKLWTYIGDSINPYTVYDYTPNRSRDGPVKFLGDYTGYMQADAFGGYDGVYASQKVIEVACWAHARRKFFDCRQTDPSISATAMVHIRQLYKIEKLAKDMSAEDRKKLRRRDSRPILKKFEKWLRSQTDKVLPKSPIGLAISYTLKNWTALKRYLEDGNLAIDNNAAERALRPAAIGRRNWMFAGSDAGGQTAAVLYSMIESCKRHHIDPFEYLRDVLSRIGDHPSNKIDELLPDNWKSAKQAATETSAA